MLVGVALVRRATFLCHAAMCSLTIMVNGLGGVECGGVKEPVGAERGGLGARVKAGRVAVRMSGQWEGSPHGSKGRKPNRRGQRR